MSSSGSLSPAQQGVLLALLLLAGFALRLAAQPGSFWVDETTSAIMAQQPLSNLWSDWMHRETNPPLYYTGLKGWSALFGGSDEALRLLSMLEGGISAGLAFLLARRVAGVKAGFIAAALMVLSPAQIFFSYQVRGYAQAEMGAMLALLGALIFADAAPGRARWTGLSCYAVGCVIALYSHTMLVLLPLLVNLGMASWLGIVRKASRDQWLAWIGANALVLLAWSWWLSITLWQISHAPNIGWIKAPSVLAALQQLPPIYGPGHPLPPYPVLTAVLQTLGLAAAAVALLVMIRTNLRRPALLLAICAVFPPVLLFLISHLTPVMVPRVFFWALGPMLVCVAIGIRTIRAPWLRHGVLGALLLTHGLGAWELTGRLPGEPFREIVAGISRAHPRATVIGNSMDSALSLRRYCPVAHCGLSIAALKVARENWSADIPMPRIARQDLPALLRRKGELYVVFRSLGREAVPELAPIGTGVNITRTFGAANYVIVERWRLKGQRAPAHRHQFTRRSP